MVFCLCLFFLFLFLWVLESALGLVVTTFGTVYSEILTLFLVLLLLVEHICASQETTFRSCSSTVGSRNRIQVVRLVLKALLPTEPSC